MKLYLKYHQAENHLKEADVLLFRSTNFISRLISKAGEGIHSHVALVTKNGGNGRWEAVEFKEWKGGRVIDLERYINSYKGEIDLYRSDGSYVKKWYSSHSNEVMTAVSKLDQRRITNCMRELTGLPYGWRRILWIAKHKMFLLRLFNNIEKIIEDMPGDEIVYPVCSTSIAHCFNKAGFDLVKNRSDEATEPADIARSCILNYLFTFKD